MENGFFMAFIYKVIKFKNSNQREFLLLARAREGWGKGNIFFGGAFCEAKNEIRRRRKSEGGQNSFPPTPFLFARPSENYQKSASGFSLKKVRISFKTDSYPSLKLRNSMHYTYILLSSKFHKFYFGSTNNLKNRFKLHNSGHIISTKPGIPWKLVWYAAFLTEKEARDFELYLKSGSGKSFAYNRFVPEALKKDFLSGRKGSPKSKGT